MITMAGNKVKDAKSKGKDDKGKSTKVIGHANEESEDPDLTLLRKPILTSITGFAQARKIFDFATEELKELLSNECDLLYECKVCRNIFRSLLNFISHKRVYCQEKFNMAHHGHFIRNTSDMIEISKIKQMEREYQESLKENQKMEITELCQTEDRIPLTKDLTAIIEKIAKNRGVCENNNEEPELFLQKIPSSSMAVFQNFTTNPDKNHDTMRNQVKEIDAILSRNKAVLQSDGKFNIQSSVSNESDSVIQISDDEDNGSDVLKCKVCDLQFSTLKTLKFHMKYKHLESRLVYPCPDCLEIFSTSWSVYRHLFKVHRKTAAQIRRLRESIQAKAFRMNNPPAFYEKRKNNNNKSAIATKITEEERLDQENQAWMDNMEGDGEIPRCGGCGRAFERRAALAAHTHTCQPRSRALARRTHETKKIEIQIRKDYNKGPPANLILPVKASDPNDNKTQTETIPEQLGLSKQTKETEKNNVTEVNLEDNNKDDTMDVLEEMQHSNNSVSSDLKEHVQEDDKICISKPQIRLPFALEAEKSNKTALRQKVLPDMDLEKLICKMCDSKFRGLQDLFDHVAGHYKWMRYACKLCTFKHYEFDKLPEHVKVVHKLKGDKDFYFSTVKALDGPEAIELCQCTDESNETNETSPESRRPSRCSSDSSRLSDDSSSSSTRAEIGSRKRKIQQSKFNSKKKKEVTNKVKEDLANDLPQDVNGESELSSNVKTFEENSSDIDDIEEKIVKRQVVNDISSVASRRPVRRKAKPKNEDFEYDLSNLLKMEAQGYRESQPTSSTKSSQVKRKNQQDNQINYEIINREHCGALLTLSKRAVEKGAAHMRTPTTAVFSTQKDPRHSNIFVRPLLPRSMSKGEKISPKKDTNDTIKDSPVKSSKKDVTSITKDIEISKKVTEETVDNTETSQVNNKNTLPSNKGQNIATNTACEMIKTNINISAGVPIKLRRQSLEVMKNPVINKNITDFTKAGMKTKILVIKPINRNKDGSQINTPLKFQTIKLKDPNKCVPLNENKSSDQVVVVKVPKVDCQRGRPIAEIKNAVNENSLPSGEIANNMLAIESEAKSAGESPVEDPACMSVSDELKSIENTSSSIACNVSNCNDKRVVNNLIVDVPIEQITESIDSNVKSDITPSIMENSTE